MGVAGELFHDQPLALSGGPVLHAAAAVRGQAVPHEGDLAALEEGVHLGEELDQGLVVVGAGAHLEDELGVAAVGFVGQGAGHGQPLPAEAMAQQWGLAPRSPGGPHRRQEGEPRLVLEDDQRTPPPGVFFTFGHRSRTHRSMASSSRSTARRAGRWRVQPSCSRRIRHTCPRW